ncbi:MAG: hypothetical protein KGL10_09225 [Alphaproteobacteria bacterium]|nr:hypothetical protein [Alphaproteobacteria bacterium]MDE2337480.1 hypothetical protein [Alphaproteobacteria bacterium]
MKNIAAVTSPEDIHEAPAFRIPETHHDQAVPATISRTLSPARLLSLLHAAEKSASVSGTPALLFMGAHKGAGADIVAFEAAYAAALTGRRVLFIDTNGSASDTIREIRGRVPMPLNVGSGGVESIAPFVNVQGTSLFFATLDEYEERDAFFPDGKAHGKIIDELRSVFGLIVVYAEAGAQNPLATILSGIADASVLVAEEGSTRIPVIGDLRRLVEMHGGRVAGVVLNKCRSHIPPSLYRALFGL